LCYSLICETKNAANVYKYEIALNINHGVNFRTKLLERATVRRKWKIENRKWKIENGKCETGH